MDFIRGLVNSNHQDKHAQIEVFTDLSLLYILTYYFRRVHVIYKLIYVPLQT